MEHPRNEVSQPNNFEFGQFIAFFLKQKEIDLSLYRQTFVQRRLAVRMSYTKTASLADYVHFIKKNPEEVNLFLNSLGINVTEFFRDADVFTTLRKSVIPKLLEKKTEKKNSLLRIWSAACASGEEAYSLALVMMEALQNRNDISVHIWATDMDEEALSKAMKAEYEAKDVQKLDKKILEKYFIPVYNNRYQLNDQIRQIIKFQAHNLITDPVMSFMDIIFCRNMMIYLTRKQQEVLLSKLHAALNPGGFLVVGKIENVWNKDLFIPFSLKDKIFQKPG